MYGDTTTDPAEAEHDLHPPADLAPRDDHAYHLTRGPTHFPTMMSAQGTHWFACRLRVSTEQSP